MSVFITRCILVILPNFSWICFNSNQIYFVVLGFFEFSNSDPALLSDSRSTEIYINCDSSWDELQIIISRSTTPDIIKMTAKLEDFFDQQHRSGVRALSSLTDRSDYLRRQTLKPLHLSDSSDMETQPGKSKCSLLTIITSRCSC